MNISAYHTLDAKPNPKNKTYIFDTILSKNKAKKDFQKYRSPQLTFYNL